MANKKKQRKNTKRPANGPRPGATSKPDAAPAKKGVTAPKGAPTAKRGTKNEVAKDRASWAVLYAGIAVVVIVIGFAVFSAVRESRAESVPTSSSSSSPRTLRIRDAHTATAR